MKHNWIVAEIEACHRNFILFEKKLAAEEIERLENECEFAPPHIKQWCERKIKELKL